MPKWTKEQLSAINEDGKNIIVSAGAGSGKTAVLSERVIRKLKEGVNIDELLVLTFTKAAAKEMKERIRKKIKKEKDLSSQLDLIDSAYITTFDSYSLSILKKYHYVLNLSPDIKVTDSSLILLKKKELLDQIFDRLYSEDNIDFENFIGTFCIKDDNEIKKYILNIYSKLELKTNRKEYLKNYINNSFLKCKIDEDINTFEKFLISKLENIRDILEELSFVVDGEYYFKLEDNLRTLLDSKNYEEILLNINVLLPTLPHGSSKDAKTLKLSLTDEIKSLKLLIRYTSKDEIYKSIMSIKEYVNQIVNILLILDEKITDYKMKNEIYEFNDIASLSIKILRENETIRNEIKDKFNEIMIDEYQDTNDIQEEFISLISNNNVYMVGDIKQSIYRFRNANPYIFKNKYDLYKNNIEGIKIDLNKNFRSRKEVLDNINKMFDFIMNDDIGGADYRKSHRMIFGNNSYIEKGITFQNNNFEIYNYNYDAEGQFQKEEIEAFIIASDIKEKIKNNYKVFDKDEEIIRPATYNDFVILMDKSTNFNLYKKIFEYMGVPLIIDKDESIINEMTMIVIKNLLVLINKIYENTFDIEFKYVFISIARSFLINMEDEEIFDIFNKNNLWNNELYKKCKCISEKLDYINIKELIIEVMDTFNFYEKIISIGDVSSNIAILDYVLNLSENFITSSNNVKDFIDYLSDLTNEGYDIKINHNKDNTNSVRIMTIHKSKGLEYHICYYSGLYSKFNISDLNDKFMYDNKYGIISPYFDDGIASTIYKDLLKEDYIKEEISEKIRLFYVALTRAKEKMILVCSIDKEEVNNVKDGIVKSRLKYRSFKDILISISSQLNDYIVNIDLEKINLSKDYLKIKKSNFKDYISKVDETIIINELNIQNQQNEEKTFSKKKVKLLTSEENENIKLGLDAHYALECIDFINPDFENLNVSDYIKDKIKKFLSNDILKNIKDAKIYKEYEFMYKDDSKEYHGIIDLMLIYDEYVDIIDYKLKNIIDENYIKQLQGYKKYIENKTNKKVNTYLYSILDEKIDTIISE